MVQSKLVVCDTEERYLQHIKSAEEMLGAKLDSIECRPGSYPCMVSIVWREPPQKTALVWFDVTCAKKLLQETPGAGPYDPYLDPAACIAPPRESSQLKAMLQNIQESLRYQLANSVAITRLLDEAKLLDPVKMKKYFAIVLSEIDARTVEVPDNHTVDAILARATQETSRGTPESDSTQRVS